jgi:hypothetical protein
MPAAAPRGYTFPAARVMNKFTGVALYGRSSEPRYIAVGNSHMYFIRRERIAPTAAEKDTYIDRPRKTLVGEISRRFIEK